MADNKEALNGNNVITNEVLPEDNTIVHEVLPEEVSLDLEGTPILFSPLPANWGDCEGCEAGQADSPEKSTNELSNMPKVLSHLFASGARYETAPDITWQPKDSERVRLRKELSVVFSVDTLVSSNEIIYGFDAAGIDVEEIISIQRRASNNSWCVSFRSPEAKNMALGVQSVTIAFKSLRFMKALQSCRTPL